MALFISWPKLVAGLASANALAWSAYGVGYVMYSKAFSWELVDRATIVQTVLATVGWSVLAGGGAPVLLSCLLIWIGRAGDTYTVRVVTGPLSVGLASFIAVWHFPANMAFYGMGGGVAAVLSFLAIEWTTAIRRVSSSHAANGGAQ